METHRRSLAKAVSWRVFALAITVVITWVVTGEAALAASVGVLDAVVKIGSFYLHERAWNRLKFGVLDRQ